MNLSDLYYNTNWGCYPFKDITNYEKTSMSIDYLKENNFTDNEIMLIINTSEKDDYLKIENIDESFWNDSLTNKNEFYYHNQLRIQSKRPKWNPITEQASSEEFFLEMKMRYTLNDLLVYYYIKTDTPPSLMDKNKDEGALKYLLKKYERIETVHPVDFVLHLIDYSDKFISSPLDIADNEKEVLEILENKILESELYGSNRIIWRNN